MHHERLVRARAEKPAAQAHPQRFAIRGRHRRRIGAGRPLPTWMGMRRLDYIFTDTDLAVSRVVVPQDTFTRRASDHVPLVADLVF